MPLLYPDGILARHNMPRRLLDLLNEMKLLDLASPPQRPHQESSLDGFALRLAQLFVVAFRRS